MLSLKKWSRGLIALTLFSSAAALQAREMVSVARPEVNMRTGAGTRHATLWELTQGYPLEVTGRSGNWLKVRDFENDAGWVYRPLVNKTPHVIVKSRVANVRSTPGTRGRVLGKADYGEVLHKLEQRNGWVKVQRESGVKGWIARHLLWGW
ncbi:SH3 domain-containing protein [Rhodoferax sp.]|uniref:SH3 domain-containing protein n=1 Tax=Rhodoferax sp. TaxID=50421 RepID=UPI0025CE5060|nr:SH3 domain-containing protein [Rhodoferax sp.]MCM2341359.1 SH3 domain-containing protein [Rhodoferax sp.]